MPLSKPLSRRVVLRPQQMPDMISDVWTDVTPAEMRTPLGVFTLLRQGRSYVLYAENPAAIPRTPSDLLPTA